MRATLLRLLGEGAHLQSSYLPGRSGYLVTTRRPLDELRLALSRRWARRLYPVHAGSGRLFLEPTSHLLAKALRDDRLELWWTPAHQRACQQFFTPVRRERIRRLPPAGQGGSPGHGPVRGLREARALALRLEALSVTPRPDKHWRGLAEAFDQLWAGQALYTLQPDPLHGALYAYLRRCLDYSGSNALAS